MAAPITLILLYGGKSGEHEVSLRSAASVLKHLDPLQYHILPVGLDKKGCFYLNNYKELLAYDSLPVNTEHSRKLPSLLEDGRLSIPGDVIFPVMHGPLYEDGCIQGLFKLADTAYVGCDVLSSALGMDKDLSRQLVIQEGIRCARYRTLSWHSSLNDRQQFYQETARELGWPLFVKPCSLGSSVGIHKVKNLAELTDAAEDALRYDETIIVEEYLIGREIELAVLENKNPTHAPLVSLAGEIKIKHPDGFYSYSAKYLESELNELVAPAALDNSLLAELQEMAAKIFKLCKY